MWYKKIFVAKREETPTEYILRIDIMGKKYMEFINRTDVEDFKIESFVAGMLVILYKSNKEIK